ncbi:hypothetical protein PVAP13_3NG258082 [Panicum virgatum]|uniref:Uncharacterized protein n=1 Tax=Panicum virgatum TaxID=38727 RepID=A0A8T0UB49_PANVG|nr:hypothetical protein PVAP13_3NG258082 [Panicum virgatum]
MDTNNGHPVHCVRQTEVDFSDQLSEAIREKQLQRDEVVRIISTRSKSQLRATFQQYKEDRGTDIGKDINEQCRSQTKQGILLHQKRQNACTIHDK